jgi:hypothetical protein
MRVEDNVSSSQPFFQAPRICDIPFFNLLSESIDRSSARAEWDLDSDEMKYKQKTCPCQIVGRGTRMPF